MRHLALTLCLCGALAACGTSPAPTPSAASGQDAGATDTAKDATATDAAAADTVSADATGTKKIDRLAVVGSDFKVTSVSLVDVAAGKADAANFLHSGTAVTPGGTALSGDVVLAQGPSQGTFVLVDRANGVLTWVDAKDKKVAAQLNVATGFYANPQDYVAVSPTKAYVPRLGQNAKATPAKDDFDDGDDLLVIDPAAKKLTGRIALTPTKSGVLAGPGRPALFGQKLYVPNANLSADFKSIGPARVAVIDPTKDAMVDGPITDQALNCVKAAAVADGVVVICSGFFGDGPKQFEKSALLKVDLNLTPNKLSVVVAASTLGKAPFGKDLACSGTWCVAVTSGDFTAKTADELWLIDVKTGKATSIAKAGGAFAFSGLVAAPDNVFVGEAFGAAGDVRWLQIGADGKATEQAAIKSNPGGLGAVDLAPVWF